MDLMKFLRALYRRRLLLVCIPVVTVIITYFLVRYLPDQFESKSRIATGIVDQSQNVLNKNDEQESKISQEFSNLTQMMMLNKIVNQVSYKLIIHDLTSDKPFKVQSKLLKTVSADKRKVVLEAYKKHYKDRTELSLWDNDEKGYYAILQSMQYDNESLTKKLSVYRVNNSDFIDVDCIAETPDLSAFIVNTLCTEFITYYTSIVKENQLKAVNFLEKLLKEKYDAMNAKINELKNYKIHNRVLNLNEMAKSLYGQIADYESRRQVADKDIAGYTAALKDIDSRFNPADRKYVESAMVAINGDIISYKNQLNTLNDDYVRSNFDETYQRRIDSVKNRLNHAIADASDKYISNPLSAKQDLLTQKLQMEVALDLSKNSVGSIANELTRLNKKFDGLVPHEAVIQSYENAIDVASREYLEILDKFNETSMTSSFSIQLRQIQEAMPGNVLPSKKMLLTILSGMISFVFCVAVLFVLFYIDHSIAEPKELVAKTDMAVLGTLSTVKGDSVDLKEIWQTSASKDILRFRNELRSIRFEIDHEMGADNKVLTITSLKDNEGKTFLSLSLAYAYAMTSKRILLIDGNFANPSITTIVKPAHYLEDFLNGRQTLPDGELHSISILGNRGGDASLMEIAGSSTVAGKMQELKSRFDIILIETAALDQLDKAKAWLQLTDKAVAIFEKGKTVTEAKKAGVAYLAGLGKTFAGWILNKATG